jgi:hypothetical protein
MDGDAMTTTALIQDTIDKGVRTAEDIHKSLADLPFTVLEASDLLRGPVGDVRRLHDRAVGAVYGLIRRVNQQVGSFTSELLDGLDKRRRTRAGRDG